MIKRDFYLNRIIHNMWSREIKVIIGIRRCGKSVLYRKVGNQIVELKYKAHILSPIVSSLIYEQPALPSSADGKLAVVQWIQIA